MRLRRLSLRNHRNYAQLDLTPGEGVNVFIGANGQGKTNLLEAISFLAPGRGTVVTGIPVAGQLAEDEAVEIFPHRWRTRVRGIQVHHRDATTARSGPGACPSTTGRSSGSLDCRTS